MNPVFKRAAILALADKMPEGFEYISCGAYGRTFKHLPSGKVLKVGLTRSDGSMGFIAKCADFFRKRGKAPEHCVEVYEFGKVGQGWYAVMEFVHVGLVPDSIEMSWAFMRDTLRPGICALVGMHNLEDWYGSRLSGHENVCFDLHRGNYGLSQCGTRLCVFDPFGGSTHVNKFPKSVVHARTYGPQRHQGARYAV